MSAARARTYWYRVKPARRLAETGLEQDDCQTWWLKLCAGAERVGVTYADQ